MKKLIVIGLIVVALVVAYVLYKKKKKPTVSSTTPQAGGGGGMVIPPSSATAPSGFPQGTPTTPQQTAASVAVTESTLGVSAPIVNTTQNGGTTTAKSTPEPQVLDANTRAAFINKIELARAAAKSQIVYPKTGSKLYPKSQVVGAVPFEDCLKSIDLFRIRYRDPFLISINNIREAYPQDSAFLSDLWQKEVFQPLLSTFHGIPVDTRNWFNGSTPRVVFKSQDQKNQAISVLQSKAKLP